jgi:EAL domain-containing protein (putative c-di-GMP-specific phosphodiesterase class I)
MADPVFTAAQLTRLRIKGFGVALDDFGTGYASLVELHRMPVSSIKIDRSFVSHIVRDEDATAIARSIIGLGQSLKLQVVAEGVEDRETLDILRSWDCELAQGYHIARPMPAKDLPSWMRAWDLKSPAHTFD